MAGHPISRGVLRQRCFKTSIETKLPRPTRGWGPTIRATFPIRKAAVASRPQTPNITQCDLIRQLWDTLGTLVQSQSIVRNSRRNWKPAFHQHMDLRGLPYVFSQLRGSRLESLSEDGQQSHREVEESLVYASFPSKACS